MLAQFQVFFSNFIGLTFLSGQGVEKEKKKDLTRHFCQKIGRVGRVTLNTGIFFVWP